MKYENCGFELINDEEFCGNCGTKVLKETPKGKFCSKCGALINGDNKFCANCGAILESNIVDKTNQTEVKNEIKKYSGRKWFIKFPYKTIETDVDFQAKQIKFQQGSGFVTIKNKVSTVIDYDSIYNVETKNKMSTPNLIFSIIIALVAIITGEWIALIIIPFALFMGRTAETIITYSGGTYTVPIEWKSDAEQLAVMINAAVMAIKNKKN